MLAQDIAKKAHNIRLSIIEMLLAAGSGHTAGPLDMADIFATLYFNILNISPKDPQNAKRDILILSNGHIAPVLYATLAEAKFFPKKELKTLRQFGSRLQGHPERGFLPGIENTSGPLGSGLSQACGMALAMKMRAQRHRHVFCLMGDGEQNEGNIWEAVMLASKYKLSNLIAIIDRNNIQIDGPTEKVMPLDSLTLKYQAFGWHVIEIDGHNITDIIDACNLAKNIVERPVVIIAHTIAGKGVDFIEYDYRWHGYDPVSNNSKQDYNRALAELRTLRGKIRSEHE